MAMLSSLKPSLYLPASWPHSEPAAKNPQAEDQITAAIPRIIHPTSTAERWASYVLGACRAERDPRTIGIWARQVAVSYTALCESCRLLDVQPRHARDFARVLRILLMPSLDSYQLATFLDISDRRTLDAILHKAGFGQTTFPQHISVASFLKQQQFIAPENIGLRIIHMFLSQRDIQRQHELIK